MTEAEKAPEEAQKPDEMTDHEKDRHAEFNELIGLILTMDPAQYAQPWTDEMLLGMRSLLTKSVNSFPKKSRWIIELFRKFLFDNGQLIAMCATAHDVAAQHAEKEEEKDSVIVKPTAEDLKKSELSRE
jgi:hypothetical protein